ncbi:ABC transporter permease [Polaribacter sp. Hel_I_88]|uniref:ABC transporter permease n=1 Tax=Polaribacter sp. Hel_I_88 TaxID=1250006 RepID=UPI00047A597B|nr:FtsX-like permease family protein [Polaribacter sp. Hel_I_88]
MLQNSLKTAFRGFKSQAFFTTFNLVSLVASIMVIYIAITYLKFETSFDKFHENSDEIYRLGITMRSQDYSVVGFGNWNNDDGKNQVAQINRLANLSNVKAATHFITETSSDFIRFGDKEITIKDVLSTNTPKSFTNIFSWHLSAGTFSDFYQNKNSVLLTESVAKRLVSGNNNYELINKIVEIAGVKYNVAGIIKDVPKNSHFDFSLALHKERLEYWGSHVYLQAENGVNQKTIEAQINQNIATLNPRLVGNSTYKNHFLQPIQDIHLKSNILYELKTPGNINYLYLISFFALFILGICVFNYSNFTLAIKTKQSKTIGIRKVIGASRGSVIRQFIFEGILLAVIAVPLAVLFLPLVVPKFNELMGVKIQMSFIENYESYFAVLILAVLIGLVSSILPALNLSQKSAKSLFQNRLKEKGYKDFSVRKYLVISQFVIIIGITVISYFIQSQVDFIANKDLGFNKNNIVYANVSPDNLELFQQKLKQIPEVERVANGSTLAIGTFNQLTYKVEGIETIYDDANQLYMDYAAIQVYELKTTLPKSVFENTDNQQRRTIINRTAAKKMAAIKNISEEELIGTTIISEPDYTDAEGNVGFPFQIDGIFEDINLFSLREEIKPYFIIISNQVRMNGNSIIALNSESTTAGLDKIYAVYAELNEPYPLEIEFLDTNYKQLHAQDQQVGKLVFILNFIAVFLSLLGIIGITLLLIVGRTKEIGIRKVLGASVASILKISVKEYLFFIVLATVIAWPISIIVVKNWLSNFAYRIDINHFAILAISLSVLIVTFIVVGLVSLKTAISNPIDSLKTE